MNIGTGAMTGNFRYAVSVIEALRSTWRETSILKCATVGHYWRHKKAFFLSIDVIRNNRLSGMAISVTEILHTEAAF